MFASERLLSFVQTNYGLLAGDIRLMPEYFWDSFVTRDFDRMLREVEAAYEKSGELQERYSYASTETKIAMESTYREILRVVESLND